MATTLDKFFELGEHEKLVHHLAVKNYRQFMDGIRNDVPLDKLTDEDVKQFLSDWDYGQYEYGVKRLQEWLEKCFLNNPESTLSVYPDSFPFWGTWGFKALLVKVYQRKQEHQMLLAAQKEREERAWLGKIEEQARRKQAEKEYQEFLHQINQTIETLKKQLARSKKPNFSYPPWLAGYHPDLWCELTLPSEQKIEDWARPQIQERLPSTLRDFVEWDLDWQVQILPEAKYEVLGVPCLTWCFTVLILVEVHLRLVESKFTKKFHGYAYPMKVEAEDLGLFYLGPALGGHQEGFTAPIVLLSLLVKGELEAPGIAVTEHGSSSTTFVVEGFEKETVVVHDAFRRFIRDIAKAQPLGEALLGKGVIDKDTGKLVAEKAKMPLPHPVGAQASAGQTTLDNSDIIAALEVLGYKKKEINEAMEAASLSPAMCLEEKVKSVLKILGA